MTGSFLREPPASPQVQALCDEDLADGGYVRNVSRLWADQPDTLKQLFGLMSEAFTPSGLTFRQRGILVTAAASALGDSYCSLAWGGKLAFSTINDSLGAQPDAQLAQSLPREVREAVTYGRPVAQASAV